MSDGADYVPPPAVSPQLFRVANISGVAQATVANVPFTLLTLALPATLALASEVSAVVTLTATTAATNVYLSVVETANGVDTPISVSSFLSALAGGTSVELVIPDSAIYIPATGRVRTLTLQIASGTGVLSANNSAQFPSAMRVRST